jgi:hypothetical protein
MRRTASPRRPRGGAAGTAALRLLRGSAVTYPVGSDPALVVAGRYRVPGLPATYFLNARHQIVLVKLGWVSRGQLRAGLLAMNGG